MVIVNVVNGNFTQLISLMMGNNLSNRNKCFSIWFSFWVAHCFDFGFWNFCLLHSYSANKGKRREGKDHFYPIRNRKPALKLRVLWTKKLFLSHFDVSASLLDAGILICVVGLYLPFIHVSPGGFHCWGSLIFSFDSLELLVVLDDSLALDGHTTQGHRSHQAFHSHLCVILSVNRDCNFRTEKKDNKKEEGVLVPCFLKAKGWH